jgi:hypothetical protein
VAHDSTREYGARLVSESISAEPSITRHSRDPERKTEPGKIFLTDICALYEFFTLLNQIARDGRQLELPGVKIS